MHRDEYLRFGAFLLCIISIAVFSRALLLPFYPDFNVYYYAARAAFHGSSPYLTTPQFFTAFAYPPFILLILWPFQLLPFEIAQHLWIIFSCIAGFFGLYLLFESYAISFRSTKGFLWLGLYCSYFPTKFTLGMGQVNMFVFLLLSLAIYCIRRKRDTLAGVALGLSLMIKLFPILGVFYCLARGKWRLFGGLLIATTIYSIVSVLILKLPVHSYFFSHIFPDVLSSWKGDYYNQALSGFLFRLPVTLAMKAQLRFVLTAIILGTSLFALTKSKADDLAFALVIAVSIIINTFSWQHHFVWLLIPYLVTWEFLEKYQYTKRYFVLLIISFFLTAGNIAHPSALPALIISHAFYGAVLLWGLMIVLCFQSLAPWLLATFLPFFSRVLNSIVYPHRERR